MLHNDIQLLKPKAKNACEQFLNLCNASQVLRKYGYRVMLLETLRDLAVQMAYASRGRFRALPGDAWSTTDWIKAFYRMAGVGYEPTMAECQQPVTWTLQSKHLDGLAFDAVPSKDGINPDWNAPKEVLEEMHQIGIAVGLQCGVDFKDAAGKPNPDPPHYQIP